VSRSGAYAALFVALVLVSTSGPFIRASGMDAFALVVWRMALAAPLFLGWAAAHGALELRREDVRPLILGALCLSAHFCLWVKAFDLTDFASNLLLLVFQPVAAAFLGIRMGERPTRRTWLSILLALVGLAIIAGGDVTLGPRALLGDLMCVLGSVAIALFYVVTRDVRARRPLSAFMGATLAIGAIASLPVALLAGARLSGQGAASWAWLGAVVFLPTLGGHGLLNLAARHTRLYAVNVVIVLEPFLGILIGAAIFPVSVRLIQILGGAVLAVAVWVGLRDV